MRLATSFVITALVAASSIARASPCDRLREGLPTGPVAISLSDGDFASPRRACPRTELGGETGGSITLEVDKYGLAPALQVAAGSDIQLRGLTKIYGSFALTHRLELFGSIEPLTTRLVISGFQSQYVGLGHTSVGGTFAVFQSRALVASVTTRATLPTAFGLYRNAYPLSFDSGWAVSFQPFELLQIHGQLSAAGSIALTAGDPQPRVGLLAVGGVELLAWEYLSFVADLNTLTLYRGDVDYAAAALGVRASLFGVAAELSALAPFYGVDRNLAGVRLALSYRF